MILQPQLHETSLMYDTGSIYLYRIVWSVEWGFHKLQRRLRPETDSFAALWPRSMDVECYVATNEFSPYPYARPVYKFPTREDAEKVIIEDTRISNIIPKRKVGHTP